MYTRVEKYLSAKIINFIKFNLCILFRQLSRTYMYIQCHVPLCGYEYSWVYNLSHNYFY